MKFTLSWLRDHLDTEASLDEITTALTRIGLEVEGVLDRAATLAPFTVAHVLEAVPHPNADKLRVCKVDTGAGILQVVCGAPNARTGLKVVFAASGTTIPDSGLTLKPTKIRDVESNGMLVSEREMGISAESEGIIEMPEDAPVGQPFAPLMGLDDPIIEIAVTPNRADCLGIHGIARDLAAAGLGTLKTQVISAPPASGEASPARIDLGDDTHLCPLFALTRISGANNGPAPEWMQRRLRAVGLRPINALVDVTNYITIDRGRPLHVFDAAKVRGPLTVRRARAGEQLAALDGREYKLDESMVVIADDAGVQALAGIMGGAASGCDENTTDVIVEAALWNAGNVAQTGRRLGLHSDARHRFERGVDPAFARPGLDLATGMILDLCGGTATAQAIAGSDIQHAITIDFPITEVKRLTGIAASPAEIQNALKALGFAVTDQGERLLVSPPSWRADVEGKADLVEEVMRMLGLERITVTPLPQLDNVQSPILTLLQRRTRTARRALAARGLMEAVTWSFLSKREAEAFGGGADELALANPIAADLSDMRPSLLPGLLAAAQKNADRGFADVALFEVGQVFRGTRAEDQKTAAALVRRGTAKPEGAGRHWSSPASAVDVFDAKADALALLAALGVPTANVQVVPGGAPWLHPGRSGTLQLGPQVVLGTFGELHPRALKALGIEGPLAVAEIILDALPAPKAKPTRAKPALERSDLQPLSRDFAFVVDREVRAADILRAAQAAERALITSAEIFDIYEGTGVPEGKKSVAVGITLQPRGKTMTDAEIEAVAAKVVAQVGKVTGGVLRQ